MKCGERPGAFTAGGRCATMALRLREWQAKEAQHATARLAHRRSDHIATCAVGTSSLGLNRGRPQWSHWGGPDRQSVGPVDSNSGCPDRQSPQLSGDRGATLGHQSRRSGPDHVHKGRGGSRRREDHDAPVMRSGTLDQNRRPLDLDAVARNRIGGGRANDLTALDIELGPVPWTRDHVPVQVPL